MTEKQRYVLQPVKNYVDHLRRLRLIHLVGRQFAHTSYIDHIKRLHADAVFVYYERQKQYPRRICRWY